ncbi:MAG: allantoinase AllB [Vicinamibacterales bacterium]
MTYDLLVTGGRLVSLAGVTTGSLAIRDGRVVVILPAEERPPAREVANARGLHILPGVIDTHVHTRHPGHPGREDALSGSSAAAAGGITTFLEMPISKVPVNSGESLVARAEAIGAQAVVDFALYGGAGHQNLDEIASQADAGAVAFKTFLQPPVQARASEFVGLWCTDMAALRDVMGEVARTGRRHCFHCEDWPMVVELEHRLQAAGDTSGRAHARSRPPVVEAVSVATMLALAREAGGPVQVVHVSSPEAADLVKSAKARGANVTAETCPPYLFLTDEALERYGPFAKCNPPLRSAASVEALWRHVVEGTIDVIGTDHSPFLAEEKERGRTNIFNAPPGLGGLEVLLPLMLTAVHEARLPLTQVPRLLASRAAELFNLPGKGRLEPGFDADFVLVDLNTAWTFEASTCHTRSKENMQVFDGRRLHGKVCATYVRGTRVFQDGQITAAPGTGRFIRPSTIGPSKIGTGVI